MYQIYKKNPVVNKIASKLGLHIQLIKENSPFNFGTEIKTKRKKLNLKKFYFQKTAKTSGTNWDGIENGKFVPSCKKLRRIYKTIKSDIFDFYCRKNDYCLEKLLQIYKGLDLKEIPLIVLREILNLWKEKFNISEEKFIKKRIKVMESIEYLTIDRFHAKKIKVKYILNEDLAKIMGAFCADGYLGRGNKFFLEEEHFSNIQALSKWIRRYFNKNIKIEKSKRGRNSWTTEFKDAIIKRYLEIFFRFKPGSKQLTVRCPKIIRNSPFNIKKAFVLGVMTFEASMNNDGTIELNVVSKKFRDDIIEIIKKERINFNISTFHDKRKGKHTLYKLRFNRSLNEGNHVKFLSYFEKNTSKWLKMKEHIFGFEDKAKDIEEAKEILKQYYYKRRGELKMSDLLEITKNLEKLDIYNLIELINKPRGSLIGDINMFVKFNILKKEYKGRRIIYTYNEKVNSWRLPNTSLHETLNFSKPL